jgi:hypothetical protein
MEHGLWLPLAHARSLFGESATESALPLPTIVTSSLNITQPQNYTARRVFVCKHHRRLLSQLRW